MLPVSWRLSRTEAALRLQDYTGKSVALLSVYIQICCLIYRVEHTARWKMQCFANDNQLLVRDVEEV